MHAFYSSSSTRKLEYRYSNDNIKTYKMKKLLRITMLSLNFLVISNYLFSQNTFPSSGSVGIGTTSPTGSSILEIKSTTQGLLIPE